MTLGRGSNQLPTNQQYFNEKCGVYLSLIPPVALFSELERVQYTTNTGGMGQWKINFRFSQYFF